MAGLQQEEEKTSTSAVKWSACGFVCSVGDAFVYICTEQVEKKIAVIESYIEQLLSLSYCPASSGVWAHLWLGFSPVKTFEKQMCGCVLST